MDLSLSLSPFSNTDESHVRTPQEGGDLQARKRGLTRHPLAGTLKISLCCISHLVRAILLQQPELTNTDSILSCL